MNISGELISLSITVTACVFIAVGGLIGLARGGKRAAIHIGTAVLALLTAFLISVPIAEGATGLAERLTETVATDETTKLMRDIPALARFAGELPAALLAPVIFVQVFIAALVAFSVIAAVIMWAVKRRSVKKTDASGEVAVSRLCGFIFGAVRGIIIIAAICIPIAGFAGLASDAADTADKCAAEAAEDSYRMPEEYTAACDICKNIAVPLAKDGFTGFLSRCGGRYLFDRMSTVMVRGERRALSAELPGLTRAAVNAVPLIAEDPKNYGAPQSAAIDRLAAAFADDDLIKDILADSLRGMSARWLAGGDFIGIAKPRLDARAMPVLDRFLELVSDITPDELGSEIGTVGELAKLLIARRDILTASDADDIGGRLLAAGVVDEFRAIVAKSRLFAPLSDYALNIWLSYVGDELGMTGNVTDQSDKLAAELAEKVNDALAGGNGAAERLADGIKRVAADNGFEITEEALPLISEFILEYFSGRTDVGADDIKQLFAAGATAAKN